MLFKQALALILILFISRNSWANSPAIPADASISIIDFFQQRLGITIPFKDIQFEDDSTLLVLGFFESSSQKILLRSSLSKIELKVTVVHELVHWLRYQYQTSEEVWLEEGIAKVVEFLYTSIWPTSYEKFFINKNQFCLLSNSEDYYLQSPAYANSFLLAYYLYSQLGKDVFLKELLLSEQTGWDAILTAAQKARDQGANSLPDNYLSKAALLRHFAVALIENNLYKAKFGLFGIHQFHRWTITDVSSEICPAQSQVEIYFNLNSPDPTAENWWVQGAPFGISAWTTQKSLVPSSYSVTIKSK